MKYFLVLMFCLFMPAQLFAAVLSEVDLKNHYAQKSFKIIVVPGHDNVVYGTRFRDYREGDLNVALAHQLADYFKKDPNISVQVSREKDGSYAPWLAEYVEDHGKEVLAFRDAKIVETGKAIAAGSFDAIEGVPHNFAENDTGTYLYAINKYANDTNTDLVIHVHFNDYGGRPKNQIGAYSGFTVYVPDPQLKNAQVSSAVGRAVANRLGSVMPGSSLPAEAAIVVPDQELIAIGSNNSRDGASILLEYGYIYESQFRSAAARALALKEYAYQTYRGAMDYLKGSKTAAFDSTIAPLRLTRAPKYGEKQSRDVLLLQYKLKAAGVYPPYPTTLTECPMNGNFGDCTLDALVIFQQKLFGYSTGAVGPATLSRLNAIK